MSLYAVTDGRLSEWAPGRCLRHGHVIERCCVMWEPFPRTTFLAHAMARVLGGSRQREPGQSAPGMGQSSDAGIPEGGGERHSLNLAETQMDTPISQPSFPNLGSVCDICHRVIVKESHGGPKPSAGDHDPAYHVAKAYGTSVPEDDGATTDEGEPE